MRCRRALPALAAIAAVSLPGLALAQAADKDKPKDDLDIKPLRIGDKAPAIDLEHWVKGNKLDKFEPGKVYVVEFWATWCGPCRVSMPHLSDLQTQYRDYGVTFIGVSDEKLDTVKDFLQKKNEALGKPWSEVIKYTIATDPDRSAYASYMHGIGARGIPTAFIIGKDQKLEWAGSPHPESDDHIEKALEAVVKDQWDRAAFAQTFEPQAEQNRRELIRHLEQQRKFKPHEEALKAAVQSRNADAAVKALDSLIELSPPQQALNFQVQKFQLLLKDFNRPDLAYAAGEEIAKANWSNPMLLNALAWFVVDDSGVQKRDLDWAMKLAVQANDLTKEEDAGIIDTYARVYYEKGDVKNAVRLQRKAVAQAKAQSSPMTAELEGTLTKYETELAGKSQ